MKKILIGLVFFYSFNVNAQWGGAVLDTITNNIVRDEVNRQCIAIDSSNNIHIVYKRENPVSGWDLFYKKRDINAQWSDEDSVSTIAGFNPVIAASNIPGKAYVAYDALDSTDSEIFVCSNSGGPWSCIQITFDSINNTSPSIAIDSSGYIHLVWIDEKLNGQFKIEYATNLSGNWAIQELTNSLLGQFGGGASPQIAVMKNGIANIAFRGDNGNGYRIHHSINDSPGGIIWNNDIITTPNDEDLSFVMKIENDTTVHMLISGDDGNGFPIHAFYFTKNISALEFSYSAEVAPSFRGEVGDLFIDRNKIPHVLLNEISGNIYTGNVIYADSLDWNGHLLLNSADIYNANFVMDSEDHAYLLAYQGNTLPEEEIVFYGSGSHVDVSPIEKVNIPFKIISTENNLKISFNENFSGRLSLTSIDGRIIFDKNINHSNGESFTIDNLSNGFYILSTENKNGKSIEKIFLR